MSHRSESQLHGNAPDSGPVVLLIVDMINDLEFEGGDQLFGSAMPIVEHVVRLKQRFRDTGLPVVYANDNFGKWRSNLNAQVEHCLQDDVRGRSMVQRLAPDEQDYFVLKPKHSAFYSTTLDLLLTHLGTESIVITGVTTDICVLFTANDAYMRGFDVWVPHDCSATLCQSDHQDALRLMQRVLKANTGSADEIDLTHRRAC